MRLGFALFILAASLCVEPKFRYETGAASAEDSRTPCCKSENPDSAQLHRNAERLYAQFKPKEAAGELLKILQLDPRDFEATTKLSRAYLDIGDMIPESSSDWREKRMKEYRKAEEYARQAINLNPNSTWGHFYVAASLGSMALVSSTSRQIDLAGEIRSALDKALALDPKNGFAYHVYGIWHRKMAEIGKASRLFASVLFGRLPPSGNLETSIEYLKKAVVLNPHVIASRLELAKSYMADENWSMARRSLVAIRELPIQFSDDAKHKRRAEQILEEIKDR
jgi:tetratricopeptide (TPR) repeat protein